MPSLSNGVACLGPSLFASVAFCLGLVASSLCNFVRLDDDNILRKTQFMGSIGFWCYEGTGVLNGDRYEYGTIPENLWDDNFEMARALGLTANCIGFVVWLFYLCAGCLRFPSPAFLAVGCLCMCACMFEGFKFWIFTSTYFCDAQFKGCSLDTGGRCSISAVVFWFVAFLMACAHGKERMDASQEDSGDEDAPPAEKEPEEQAVEQA